MSLWEECMPVAHERSGLRLAVVQSSTERDLARFFPEKGPEFSAQVLEVLLLSYSIFRRLRGKCLSQEGEARMESYAQIKEIGERAVRVLRTQSDEQLSEMVQSLSELDDQLRSLAPYAKAGGGAYSQFASKILDVVSESSLSDWLKVVLHRFPHVFPELENGMRQLSQQGILKRIHVLGPVASGWSYLILAQLNKDLFTPQSTQAAGFSSELAFAFSPLIFDKEYQDMCLAVERVEDGDLLILFDDALGPRREAQVEAFLEQHGRSRDVTFLHR